MDLSNAQVTTVQGEYGRFKELLASGRLEEASKLPGIKEFMAMYLIEMDKRAVKVKQQFLDENLPNQEQRRDFYERIEREMAVQRSKQP